MVPMLQVDSDMQKPWDLRERTMDFAIAGFKFCRTVQPTSESRDLIRQLRKALSAVAANYRATRRSQSDPAFAAKLAIVIEEADESGFWLDFLVRLEIAKRPNVAALTAEANELVAIFTKAKKTVEARIQNSKEVNVRRRTSERHVRPTKPQTRN